MKKQKIHLIEKVKSYFVEIVNPTARIYAGSIINWFFILCLRIFLVALFFVILSIVIIYFYNDGEFLFFTEVIVVPIVVFVIFFIVQSIYDFIKLFFLLKRNGISFNKFYTFDEEKRLGIIEEILKK